MSINVTDILRRVASEIRTFDDLAEVRLTFADYYDESPKFFLAASCDLSWERIELPDRFSEADLEAAASQLIANVHKNSIIRANLAF
jgi:hypothetical protein